MGIFPRIHLFIGIIVLQMVCLEASPVHKSSREMSGFGNFKEVSEAAALEEGASSSSPWVVSTEGTPENEEEEEEEEDEEEEEEEEEDDEEDGEEEDIPELEVSHSTLDSLNNTYRSPTSPFEGYISTELTTLLSLNSSLLEETTPLISQLEDAAATDLEEEAEEVSTEVTSLPPLPLEESISDPEISPVSVGMENEDGSSTSSLLGPYTEILTSTPPPPFSELETPAPALDNESSSLPLQEVNSAQVISADPPLEEKVPLSWHLELEFSTRFEIPLPTLLLESESSSSTTPLEDSIFQFELAHSGTSPLNSETTSCLPDQTISSESETFSSQKPPLEKESVLSPPLEDVSSELETDSETTPSSLPFSTFQVFDVAIVKEMRQHLENVHLAAEKTLKTVEQMRQLGDEELAALGSDLLTREFDVQLEGNSALKDVQDLLCPLLQEEARELQEHLISEILDSIGELIGESVTVEDLAGMERIVKFVERYQGKFLDSEERLIFNAPIEPDWELRPNKGGSQLPTVKKVLQHD